MDPQELGPSRTADRPALDSVQRACRLLRALRATTSLTVRDAAAVLGVAPATAHRLLSALSYEGFVTQGGTRYFTMSSTRGLSPSATGGEHVRGGLTSVRRYGSGPPLDSVHRALVLVRAFQEGQVLSVTGASAMLGVAPATAYRLLSALRLEGFATQGHDRRYRPGAHTSRIEPRRLSAPDLSGILRPAIHELTQGLGETIHVWTLRGPFVMLIHAVAGAAVDAVPHDKWSKVPAYATASGRALLAELPNRQVESIHGEGLIPWREAKISSIHALKRRLSVVRREGFETTFEEGARGSSGLAMCVRDPWRQPMAAIGIAVPSARFHRTNLPEYHQTLGVHRARAEEALLASYGGAPTGALASLASTTCSS